MNKHRTSLSIGNERCHTFGPCAPRMTISEVGQNRPAPEHKLYSHLLGDLQSERSDQLWCADITDIRLASGFVYLAALMDWHSHYVLAWEVTVT